MSVYLTTDNLRQQEPCQPPAFPSLEGGPVAGLASSLPKSLLVSSPISARSTLQTPDTLQIFPASVRIKRFYKQGNVSTPPARIGTQITGFSDKSQSRLRWMATNAGEILKSQYGLTYHNKWPSDGREFKRHLKVFLDAVRRRFPSIKFLWIAEFQSRGCPHVHLFSNLLASDESARSFLASSWARIVDPGNVDLLAVHSHPSNFIDWEMRRGAYLCKYLDKKAQKCIPVGFENFGRFWGNTRGLVPYPEEIPLPDIDAEFSYQCSDLSTGEDRSFNASAFIVRQLGRYHEKQNRRSWFRSRSAATVSCLTAAPIARQLLRYLEKQQLPSDTPPF